MCWTACFGFGESWKAEAHALFQRQMRLVVLEGRHRFKIRFVGMTRIAHWHKTLFVIATVSQRDGMIELELIANHAPVVSTLRTPMVGFSNLLNGSASGYLLYRLF